MACWRSIFFGTSPFAATILAQLLPSELPIVAVVTRPDRGRGRGPRCSPVKQLHQQQALSIPLLQPPTVISPRFCQQLERWQPDLLIVAAFGEIFDHRLLALPARCCLNVHPSLLPEYRGAAPLQRCLMDGQRRTGVTIIEMTERVDGGAILAQQVIAIDAMITHGQLQQQLALAAGALLPQVVADLASSRCQRRQQDPGAISFAPKITAAEHKIDWRRPAPAIHDQIRALSPRPGAWCAVEIGGQRRRLKILRSRSLSDPDSDRSSERLQVTCGEGLLEVLEVQLAGRRPLEIGPFLQGLKAPLLLI